MDDEQPSRAHDDSVRKTWPSIEILFPREAIIPASDWFANAFWSAASRGITWCWSFLPKNDTGRRMKLLITNDDGFAAPGIRLLATEAATFGSVTIIAPEREQSGISHRVTFEKPLHLTEKGENAYTVDGTPADCVRVAMSLWQGQFDYVLSGMNDGANLGVDVFYSGTVAAAREATFYGIPSFAFSQYRAEYSVDNPFDFAKTRPLVNRLLTDLLANHRGEPVLTNVNLPDRAASDQWQSIRSIECDVDPSPLPGNYRETQRGLIHGALYADRPRKAGMDTEVCFGGDVSISVVRF